MNAATMTRTYTKLDDLVLLTKLRLNALVVATTAGGFYMAAPSAAGIDPASVVVTCLGTALVASGAAALNQVRERDIDSLMTRTRIRPIAAGRMSPGEGVGLGAAMAVAGLAVLWLASSRAAAVVALATLVTYMVIYTPLKRRTSLATVVGAVPGALPPLIGWTAAGGSLSGAAAWSLFLVMFVWQMPHFLAIAWLYRADYARAGLPMLPVVDPKGVLTGAQAALWAATLLPVSELPYLLGLAGATYALAALVLGLGLLVLAARFMFERTDGRARALFYGSITYLPILWLLMGIGRRG
jgi:protoheme IX farnesyltransferase